MHRVFRPAALAAVVWLVASPPASATCGATGCFLVTEAPQSVRRGSFAFDVSIRRVIQSRRLEGSSRVGEVLVPGIELEDGVLEPDHHREVRTESTLVEADLAYGLTSRLTLFGALPLWNDRHHEHFNHVGEPEEEFTRDAGTSGFGDVAVGGRYAFLFKGADLLAGGLAVKLPTGRYRLRDDEGEIKEPGIQPGTGSTDLVASLQHVHQWAPMRWESFASLTHRFAGANTFEYRLGDETLLDVGVRHRPGGRAGWSLQINGRRAGRDRFAGQAVPSTGSTLVSLTPGIRYTTGESATLYALVQVPVLQDVNESQLAPRVGLVAGVTASF